MSQTDYAKYIIPGGIVIGLLTFGSRIMEALGLKSGKDDKQNSTLFLYHAAFDPKMWRTLRGNVLLMTVGSADKLVKLLWNAVGVFNDDEQQLYGVLQQLKTKSQVSFLADRFYLVKKQSLIDYLRNHLNDTELNRVYQITNALPLQKI